MKIIQNTFLIFFSFFFITTDLYAGLGNTNWGTWGIKRDIEVNEIEEIEDLKFKPFTRSFQRDFSRKLLATEHAGVLKALRYPQVRSSKPQYCLSS